MSDESPLPDGHYRPSGPQERPVELTPDAMATDLTERFRERLRYFAMRRIRDSAAAEDVAQETLRRALEALRAGKVRNLDAMPAFLFQTARNICMHQGRSAGRGAHALQKLGSAGEDPGSAEDDGPLEALIAEERRAAVRKALDRLPSGDRQLLLLVYVELLDAAEIASRLNLQPGAVRVRKHRALRRMAELLGEESAVTAPGDREHRE